MKGRIFILCLLMLGTSLFASDDKHYCSAYQIELSNDQILVHTNSEIIEIDSLLSDQGGIYYLDSNARCIHCRRTLNPKNTCHCYLSACYNE